MKTTKTPKTIAEAIKDANSSNNQRIKEKFIQREVYCNVNSLVEYCLQKGFEDRDAPISMDSIENYYSYPEYYGEFATFAGGSESERSEEIGRLKSIYDENREEKDGEEGEHDEAIDKILDAIDSEIDTLENLESEPQEIFEWWAVSSYLFDKLKEKGCPVCDTGSTHVWGRTTTGQAILLDGVISQICAEMEILEGQVNDWSTL